ncbi:MAG: hypothetical protein FWG10_02370 [Eubacteriaceae bacterium]|nr:hypothetical protein [Eubacteriaceae bacterium]
MSPNQEGSIPLHAASPHRSKAVSAACKATQRAEIRQYQSVSEVGKALKTKALDIDLKENIEASILNEF